MRLVRMREHEVCEDEIQWRSFNIHTVRACVRYRIRHQKTDGIGKEKELLYLEDDSQYEYWNKARRALSEWVNMGVF